MAVSGHLLFENIHCWLFPPQIQEMARMNPSQRLELLKEMGGTKVYEERRRESIKVMTESDNKRNQVIT